MVYSHVEIHGKGPKWDGGKGFPTIRWEAGTFQRKVSTEAGTMQWALDTQQGRAYTSQVPRGSQAGQGPRAGSLEAGGERSGVQCQRRL